MKRNNFARVLFMWSPNHPPHWWSPSAREDSGCIGLLRWVNSDPAEDAWGRCWWGRPESDDWSADWTLATPEAIAEFCEFSPRVTWLPFNALPLPGGEVE